MADYFRTENPTQQTLKMPPITTSQSTLTKRHSSTGKKDLSIFWSQINYQIRIYLVIILLLPPVTGCYHYRVIAPEPDPATDYESRLAHSLFWGLLQSKDITADDCLSNALDEVRITTNLGYSFISLATIGIWMPMNIQWKCAKEPSLEGEI
jgi:hypothetical protein